MNDSQWMSAGILFLTVIVSAAFAKIILERSKLKLEIWLIFASTYLLTTTIVHLIPEVYTTGNQNITSLFILAGFILQLFLDYLSQGIEHGHTHKPPKGSTEFSIRSLMMVMSLGLHAFFESSLLSKDYLFHNSHSNGHTNLLISIILHKIPATIAMCSIFQTSKNKKIVLLYILVFAFSAPLGLLTTPYWLHLFNSQWVYAVVCGMILHLALVIFFENHKHQPNFTRIFAILLGTGVALIVNFWS